MTKKLLEGELQLAAELLKQGELVAFPTETVYGLGALVFNEEAIRKIFSVKGRPSDNPLIVHVADWEQIALLVEEIPPLFHTLYERFFPGPLTVVMKKRPQVPSIVSGGLDSVALRMPSHPLARKLISLCQVPIVAPSANLSGRPSSTRAEHVLEDFDGKIAAVVDGGPTDFGIESTVVSLLGDSVTLLREGAIAREDLEEALGMRIAVATKSEGGKVLSPGMKYRHYAPQTPIRLFSSAQQLLEYASPGKSMLLSREPFALQGADHYVLCSKDFYSHLRHADAQQYSEILIFCDQLVQRNAALMNRINRSAGNS
ncbi:MAG: L-threonylcarbamoyladenylate synthase [Chlamydiota bacterium]